MPSLRRRHDVVFTGSKVVVDVYGCFWHGCPDHYVEPKTNSEFWREKIATNRARDTHTARELADSGWIHIVVWEHEEAKLAAEVIADVIRTRAKTE